MPRTRSVPFRGALALAAAFMVTGAATFTWAPPATSQGALTQLQTDVDHIARHGRPSVVTVLSRRTLTHGTGRTGRPRVQTRVGTGVALAEDEILTTASVVLHGESFTVRTVNGLQCQATLVGIDPIYNLALLRVSEIRLPPLRLAPAGPPQVGDWVITLGTSYRATPTQSVGTVAYLHREPRFLRLQVTNASYPGNSGGAALNARGELVGLVQGELGFLQSDTRDGGASSTGGDTFVLAAENLQHVWENLRQFGRMRYGFLGVSTRGASVEAVSERGARVPIGALVERITAGSPAARAGIREGDLIVAFDGERVEYSEQLARWVAASAPGSRAELVWVRDERPLNAVIALGESPAQTPAWAIGPAPLPRPASADQRIEDLERQIHQLNRQLGRLRGDSAADVR